jgi:hypothetical protein
MTWLFHILSKSVWGLADDIGVSGLAAGDPDAAAFAVRSRTLGRKPSVFIGEYCGPKAARHRLPDLVTTAGGVDFNDADSLLTKSATHVALKTQGFGPFRSGLCARAFRLPADRAAPRKPAVPNTRRTAPMTALTGLLIWSLVHPNTADRRAVGRPGQSTRPPSDLTGISQIWSAPDRQTHAR